MLEEGQILPLRIKFNNSGICAEKPHPLLIVGVDLEKNLIEVAHLDSIDCNDKKKIWRALKESNEIIKNTNPVETVIDKDSYVQLDTKYTIENFPELEEMRRQKDKLSSIKFKYIKDQYKNYHKNNWIDESKTVYMSKEEIKKLNNMK